MALSELVSFKASVRAGICGVLGSEQALVRETFSVVERRGDWKLLKLLLSRCGASALPWKRSWAEQSNVDPNCFWESKAHGLADFRSPLMCALLAAPRHSLLASVCSDKASSKSLLRSVGKKSLVGLSIHEVLDKSCNIGSCIGAAARTALTHWQLATTDALLAVGGKHLANLTDACGRTALHYSAATGDEALVKRLVEFGLDRTSCDSSGQTPAHVAAAHGHVELASWLSSSDEKTGRDMFARTVNDIIAMQASRHEYIPTCKSISSEELFANFVALNRPVLVRGGAAHLPAMTSWSNLKKIEDLLQEHELSVGVIPYRGGAKNTLREFISGSTLGRDIEGPQSYVFDVSIAAKRPQMFADAELLPLSTRKQFLAYVRQPQFGLGFGGSGAPMHSHYAAMNALFKGSKRWFLLPPHAGFWSLEPSSTWVDSEECARLREEGLLLEIVQEAGDLMFVPAGWGHATLLEDFGVGIGQEFIPNSSMAA